MQGKDALTQTYWSLLRTSLYLHHQLPETSVWFWTIRFAAPQASLRWPDPADLPLQHPQDPAVPHEESSLAPGPSARHLAPRLQHLAPGWTPCLGNYTFAAYPERCSAPCVQPTVPYVTSLFRDLHWLLVVACIRLNDSTGLQGSQRDCPCLPPSVGQITHPSSSAPLNYFRWTSGNVNAKSK